MGVLDFLSGIVKPITDLIDNLSTSDEERGKLQNELTCQKPDYSPGSGSLYSSP